MNPGLGLSCVQDIQIPEKRKKSHQKKINIFEGEYNFNKNF